MKKKNAYTLMELLAVVATLGILVVVLIAAINFAINKARVAGVQTDLRSFQLAFEAVAVDNAGFSTFGWDEGDINGDRIINSYDSGDINRNGIVDGDEHWTGLLIRAETWTGRFTLVNPADPDDNSAVVALEAAINKKLDRRLHIRISDKNQGYVISMANAAKDPWKVEYHGQYISSIEGNSERGAIVMYSNGSNKKFGSEAFFENGVAIIGIPGGEKIGQDDLAIAVTYSLRQDYGEVLTDLFGFAGGKTALFTPSYSEREFVTGRIEFADGSVLNWDDVLVPANAEKYGYNINGMSATQIPANAFKYCSELVSLTIPEGVAVIGNFAFRGCTNLVSVKIPDSVTGFGKGVFWDTGLETILLPTGITELSQETFRNCSSLKHVVIPNGVETVGIYAFSGCSSLESVVFPATLKNIGTNAFYNCKSLKTISIPDGAVSIGDVAFRNCTSLTSVYLPDTISDMGKGVFWNCRFSSINIPTSMSEIPQETFRACSELETVILHEGLEDIGIYAFSDCEKLVNINFPNSLRTVGTSAFDDCSSLATVTFNEGLASIGSNAFKGCSSLTDLYLPNSISSIGNGAFWDCAFEKVNIPTSLTQISQEVFRACLNLSEVIIPEGVEVICPYAFSECKSLAYVSFPVSLISIQENAFRMNVSLETIKYAGRVTQWALVTRASEWDYGIPCEVINCSNGDSNI